MKQIAQCHVVVFQRCVVQRRVAVLVLRVQVHVAIEKDVEHFLELEKRKFSKELRELSSFPG